MAINLRPKVKAHERGCDQRLGGAPPLEVKGYARPCVHCCSATSAQCRRNIGNGTKHPLCRCSDHMRNLQEGLRYATNFCGARQPGSWRDSRTLL